MDYHFCKVILIIIVCGISTIVTDDSDENHGDYGCNYLLVAVQQQLQRLNDRLAMIEQKSNGNAAEYDLINQSKSQLKWLNERMLALDGSIKNIDIKLTNLVNMTSNCNVTPAKTEAIKPNVFPTKAEAIKPNIFPDKTKAINATDEIAQLRYLEGLYVSDYTWKIDNILKKIEEAVTGNETVDGPEFYSDKPGYKLKLLLSPNYRLYNYIGVFLGVVPGKYDDELSWPFNKRFQMSSLARDGTVFANFKFDPVVENSTCTFYKPKANIVSVDLKNYCGFWRFVDVDELITRKQFYLHDGALIITTTIFLEE